jgi:hypothetical protein
MAKRFVNLSHTKDRYMWRYWEFTWQYLPAKGFPNQNKVLDSDEIWYCHVYNSFYFPNKAINHFTKQVWLRNKHFWAGYQYVGTNMESFRVRNLNIFFVTNWLIFSNNLISLLYFQHFSDELHILTILICPVHKLKLQYGIMRRK